MLGHAVSATLWHVVVQFRSDDLSDPHHKAYSTRHINVLTATVDGSDVFENTRKEFYVDAEEAQRFEFQMLQFQHVGQVNGTALGAFEQRGQA